MAKYRPAEEQIAAVEAPTVTTSEDDGDLAHMRGELARLRRENEILRGKVSAPPPGLDTTPGQVRTYRVSLPKFRPHRCSRVVSRRLTAGAHLHRLPTAEYNDLDLFAECDWDPSQLNDAAWRRYCGEGHGIKQTDEAGVDRTIRLLDPVRDRASFRILPQMGPLLDHLDIPATSAAEAFHRFCKACGISATSVKPSVELLAGDGGPAISQDVPSIVVL